MCSFFGAIDLHVYSQGAREKLSFALLPSGISNATQCFTAVCTRTCIYVYMYSTIYTWIHILRCMKARVDGCWLLSKDMEENVYWYIRRKQLPTGIEQFWSTPLLSAHDVHSCTYPISMHMHVKLIHHTSLNVSIEIEHGANKPKCLLINPKATLQYRIMCIANAFTITHVTD